jgi:hypothetical protein
MFSQLQAHVGTRGKVEKELNVTKSAVLQLFYSIVTYIN